MTPPVRVVPPVYVLVPEIVRVPVPVLVSATVPDPLASTPAKVVEALPARPPDRVTAPAAPLVMVDPATPAIEPTVSEKPLRSNVAPEATLSAELAPTALAIPARSVPPLTAVAPVYVPAADTSSVPAPALVRPPAPEITPDNVTVEVAEVTVTELVAANDSCRLSVFADPAALEERPVAARAIRLPARV